ncbi:hypothetical protein PO124_01450 [Bacillus licheniformis]|nr:hypothetical protein [Bacillus licheniformis]
MNSMSSITEKGCRHPKTDLHDWVFADQTHEDRIHKVTDGDRASGAFRYDTALKATDGLYTDRPNLFWRFALPTAFPFILRSGPLAGRHRSRGLERHRTWDRRQHG